MENGTLGLVMAECGCGCDWISAHLKVLQFLKAKVRESLAMREQRKKEFISKATITFK